MQVEGQHWYLYQMATGARVRNAYRTYLLLENSPEKFGLMLHSIMNWHRFIIKDLLVRDGYAFY